MGGLKMLAKLLLLSSVLGSNEGTAPENTFTIKFSDGEVQIPVGLCDKFNVINTYRLNKAEGYYKGDENRYEEKDGSKQGMEDLVKYIESGAMPDEAEDVANMVEKSDYFEYVDSGLLYAKILDLANKGRECRGALSFLPEPTLKSVLE